MDSVPDNRSGVSDQAQQGSDLKVANPGKAFIHFSAGFLIVQRAERPNPAVHLAPDTCVPYQRSNPAQCAQDRRREKKKAALGNPYLGGYAPVNAHYLRFLGVGENDFFRVAAIAPLGDHGIAVDSERLVRLLPVQHKFLAVFL